MGLSIGIVGLPNVGKSTLFSALTHRSVDVSNYPFCTIEPNVGVVPVPDPRLDRIGEIVQPERTIHATVEFVDVAGLVKGASEGEGLGNRFLATIREVDAIAEVVRFFSDPDVVHVTGRMDPADDVETVRTELVLADLGTVERALPRLQKEAKRERSAVPAFDVARRAYDRLAEGRRASTLDLTPEERLALRDLHLLTLKPMLYVANIDEADIGKTIPQIDGVDIVGLCARIEAELAELEPDELAEYLEAEGLAEPGLDVLLRGAYELLGLHTYFTFVPHEEARAWTLPVGGTALEAAAQVHTDMARGFIKAEVIAFADFDELGSESAARAVGKVRIEGRDYVVQDGDILRFKFNA